jgi:gluconolactonase
MSMMTKCLAAALLIPAAGLFAQTTRPSPAALMAATLAWTETNPDSPVVLGAKLQKLGEGYIWTEGPASDKEGNIFFVEQDADTIWRYGIDGTMTKWLHPSGYSNGMCFDADGNLISCADEKNELWSIAPDKKITVLVKDYKGKLLNGPNDVWIRPDGGMYLTDPYYPRTWWTPPKRPIQQDKHAVYFLSPDRKTLTRVADDFEQPNGIIGKADGSLLYISDINAGHTYSYTMNPDGSLANKKLFCDIGSDGMTIDSDGNVYTSARGRMQITNPDGKLIESIPVRSANNCFGGKDGHMLFITALHEVWGLQMKTSRVGSQ